MLKKMMITTAVSALMMGSALAANETDKPGAAPAASSTEMKSPAAPTTSTEMKTPAAPSTSASSTPAAKTEAKFVNSQRQDQFLASKFKGTDVIGADDKKIGDVSDILFDKDGKIEAYVVGVGGFLGIGAKEVAVGMDKLKFMTDKDGKKYLYTNFTKDQLQAQAAYDKGSYAEKRDQQRMMMQ